MQTTTLEVCPVPHQNDISGTTARIGTAWRVTRNGKRAFSTDTAWLIKTAKKRPIRIAKNKPIPATFVEDHNDWSISDIPPVPPQSRNPSVNTLSGGLRRNRRFSASMMYEMKYHAPITKDPKSIGGKRLSAIPLGLLAPTALGGADSVVVSVMSALLEAP
jgi:hypothetical protein